MTDARELLLHYVEAHNQCVRTGCREELIALFSPRAEFRFEGIAFPTMRGRDEIDAAFRDHAPDDVLVIRSIQTDGKTATAVYEWGACPGVLSGELQLGIADGLIETLVVTVSNRA